ncbi:unnamed protein product [Prunus brigantina]
MASRHGKPRTSGSGRIRSENLIKPNIWGWELRSWKLGFEN